MLRQVGRSYCRRPALAQDDDSLTGAVPKLGHRSSGHFSLPKERLERGVIQGVDDAALLAGRGFGREHGVEDGFLDRLDGGLEQRVDVVPAQELQPPEPPRLG